MLGVRGGGGDRVQAGAAKDRKGNPMTILLKGPVEVWFKDTATGAAAGEPGA